MAGVETKGERGERGERTQGNEKTSREWATVAPKHTHANEMEKGWATVACSSAKQGFWYLYAESESVAIQCTLRREREGGGKGNEVERESVLPATERAASYAKRVRYSDRKQRMNVITTRDSGREVERSGEGRCPMARETIWKLEKRATILNTEIR
jgi:hypothetical protein